MSDTFNLKRFLHYGALHYYNKRISFFYTILCAALLILISCGSWHNGGSTLGLDVVSNNVNHYIEIQQSTFISTFFTISIFFIYFFSMLSMSSAYSKQRLSVNDLTLGVSTTERYLFGLISSIVVAPILYIGLFSLMSTYIESSYYFYNDGNSIGYIANGFLDTSALIIPEGYEHVNIFSLSTLIEGLSSDIGKPALLTVAMCALYTFIASVVMWGSVTFKSGGAHLAAVIHLVLGGVIAGVIGYTSAHALWNLMDSDLSVVGFSLIPEHIHQFGGVICTSALIIATIVYQVVIYRKIKTLSVSH